MIIIPNIAGKKEPVTLSAYGAYNTTSYSAGDLLLFFSNNNIGAGLDCPVPTGPGWTKITPNPDFTNMNQSAAWKVATSSSENFSGIAGNYYNNIFVFKNGVTLGSYAASRLTYTTPAQMFFAPTINLRKTDGSSFVLHTFLLVVPPGISGIIPENGTYYGGILPNNSYNFAKQTNTALTTIGGSYYGALNQGLHATFEISNE